MDDLGLLGRVAERASARFEVVSERLANDLGDGKTVLFGPASETLLQLRIESDGFGDGRCRAQSGAAAPTPTGDDLVDAVASLRFADKLSDEVAIDRRACRGVSVRAPGHGSRSFRAIALGPHCRQSRMTKWVSESSLPVSAKPHALYIATALVQGVSVSTLTSVISRRRARSISSATTCRAIP